MYDQINQISILDVLNKLGFQYQLLSNGIIGIMEDGKLTNGRRGNIRGNFINDFSGKNRPRGSPFSLVKQHLDLTDHETFTRFKSNFDIRDEIKRPKNKGSPKQKKNKVVEPYSRNRLQL